MGWWGEGIMEGDTPADVAIFVQEGAAKVAGFDEEMEDTLDDMHYNKHPDFEKTVTEYRERIQKAMQDPDNVNAMIKHVEDRTNEPGWEWGIVAMAVVHEIITRGWYLPTEQRASAIDAANSADISGWRNPAARRKALKQFAKAVRAYKGKPVELVTRGLMDMVALRMLGVSEVVPRVRKSKKQLRRQRRRNKPWSN